MVNAELARTVIDDNRYGKLGHISGNKWFLLPSEFLWVCALFYMLEFPLTILNSLVISLKSWEIKFELRLTNSGVEGMAHKRQMIVNWSS